MHSPSSSIINRIDEAVVSYVSCVYILDVEGQQEMQPDRQALLFTLRPIHLHYISDTQGKCFFLPKELHQHCGVDLIGAWCCQETLGQINDPGP